MLTGTSIFRKTVRAAVLGLACTSALQAQPGKGFIDIARIPVPQWHYLPEFTFDKPLDRAVWAKQEPGLHAAFGSTDELYLRCEVPGNDLTRHWEASGWRGERINAQVLIWSPDTAEQVRLTTSDLVSASGKVVSRNFITTDLVRYVVSNYRYGAGGFTCDQNPMDSAWLMPDRFEPFERFDLPGKTVRPVWVTLDIPASCEPGSYNGTIGIRSTNGDAVLHITLRVQKQVLPDPHNWKFRLDLWQNPWVIASYYHVAPWSAEHRLLLKKHLKLYAEAGGKYITTYAVYSPWSDNSYMVEGTMIEWTKQPNGSWKFDYSVFDEYVEIAMEAGIDEAITVYTPVPWGYRFRYMDEKTGNYVFEEWPPASPQFKLVWNIFLDDLKAHLVKKGWFGKTYLGINENPLEITLAAIRVIRENSKDWKITYAGDWHPELSSLLTDYSPVLSSEPDLAELGDRKSKGQTTTFYVCCNPQRPNNFVFSPPVEGRFIGWYAAACGYNGFLRWAYDAWPADPVRDARHSLWPAGDCFLVYPGGNSCIRFEKLREGIADYEKIRMLREIALKSTSGRVKELLQELDALLSTLAAEREYTKRDLRASTLTEALKKGNSLIAALSNELGQ